MTKTKITPPLLLLGLIHASASIPVYSAEIGDESNRASQSGKQSRSMCTKPIIGVSKPEEIRLNQSYPDFNPSEWQFLGRNIKDVRAEFDRLSPCQSAPDKFWFFGCGGIEGGGFIQVKYDTDGKVTEAWYCSSTCTHTWEGKHFSDKNLALKYAIAKSTKEIEAKIEDKSAYPSCLRRYLMTRAMAYAEIGDVDRAKIDYRRIDNLFQYESRYQRVRTLTIAHTVTLARLEEEFAHNGFQKQKISPNKYRFTKGTNAPFDITIKNPHRVNVELATWCLHEDIARDAIKVMD